MENFKKIEETRRELLNRNEHIVVLNHNTINYIDLPIQIFLYSLSGTEPDSVEELMMKLLCSSSTVDKMNGIEPDLYKQMMDMYFDDFYNAAPVTDIVRMLDISKHQRFTNSISLLSDKYTLYNRDLFNEFVQYKDLQELANYLNNNDWTVLVAGDVEVVWKLASEYNVDFNQKTLIISRIGYNYFKDKYDTPQLKYYVELTNKFNVDITAYSLFTFFEKDGNEDESADISG